MRNTYLEQRNIQILCGRLVQVDSSLALWRNGLARSAVNRKVDGSNPSRDVLYTSNFGTKIFFPIKTISDGKTFKQIWSTCWTYLQSRKVENEQAFVGREVLIFMLLHPFKVCSKYQSRKCLPKQLGLHGNRTRDLSHPKRESYH